MLLENKKALREIVIEYRLSAAQEQQFVGYVDTIEEWSNRTNLVSKNDRKQIVAKHIAESLEIIKHKLVSQEGFLLDLGTGAGFPGIPISIVCPDLKVTLLDSRRMKVLFLKEVVGRIRAENTDVICARAENMPGNSTYNYVSARAVARLNTLWSWSHRLLANDGILIALKGGEVDAEVKELMANFEASCKVLPFFVRERERKMDKKIVIVSGKKNFR